ncbi:DNA-binding transcriptional LysR family regulator [Rhodococcus sp. OAS809]|uniref:LysR family transcriptional regulator n=1 Tax=Rhodococcus sp. OAS809 TaxID=2663874 RepID=UPI001789A8C7
MDLRHLRYFLAVAELGTVTAAAASLHIAQPAISRQLQTLERTLGISLFDRHGPKLSLTAAGRVMVDVAADIVSRADQAGMLARHIATGELPRVNAVASSTTIEYVLAPFVAGLNAGDTFVSVDEVPPQTVHTAVRTAYDLGVAATPPPVDVLAWRQLTEVPLRAYVSPGHKLSDRSSVNIQELIDEPLILPSPHDPTRQVFDRALVAGDLILRPQEVVSSPSMRLALAATGRGIAIATDLVRFGAHPVFVKDLHGSPIRLAIHACWDPRHYAAGALSDLADQLALFAETKVRSDAERG